MMQTYDSHNEWYLSSFRDFIVLMSGRGIILIYLEYNRKESEIVDLDLLGDGFDEEELDEYEYTLVYETTIAMYFTVRAHKQPLHFFYFQKGIVGESQTSKERIIVQK